MPRHVPDGGRERGLHHQHNVVMLPQMVTDGTEHLHPFSGSARAWLHAYIRHELWPLTLLPLRTQDQFSLAQCMTLLPNAFSPFLTAPDVLPNVAVPGVCPVMKTIKGALTFLDDHIEDQLFYTVTGVMCPIQPHACVRRHILQLKCYLDVELMKCIHCSFLPVCQHIL